MAYRQIELAPAIAKLKRFMATSPRITQTAFGKAIGVPQPTVWSWLAGVARPSHERRHLIALATGGKVCAADWLLASERKQLRRAVRGLRAKAA